VGLEEGVDITVGLPEARTSVDHGTAFDIAGSGGADERSITEAMRQSLVLAPGRAAAATRAWSIFELHVSSVRPGCLVSPSCPPPMARRG
jgi:pyridoxal phosphate biosynthetic protein PdxA